MAVGGKKRLCGVVVVAKLSVGVSIVDKLKKDQKNEA